MLFKKSLTSIIILTSLATGTINIKAIEKSSLDYKIENTESESPFNLFSSFAFLAAGTACLFIYEKIRKRKQKRKSSKKPINNKFVSDNGYDLCVICKVKTPYETNRNIEDRINYIQGVGQLCKECRSKLEEDYFVLESKSRYTG